MVKKLLLVLLILVASSQVASAQEWESKIERILNFASLKLPLGWGIEEGSDVDFKRQTKNRFYENITIARREGGPAINDGKWLNDMTLFTARMSPDITDERYIIAITLVYDLVMRLGYRSADIHHLNVGVRNGFMVDDLVTRLDAVYEGTLNVREFLDDVVEQYTEYVEFNHPFDYRPF